jgi:hypothetical protein
MGREKWEQHRLFGETRERKVGASNAILACLRISPKSDSLFDELSSLFVKLLVWPERRSDGILLFLLDQGFGRSQRCSILPA